MNHEAARLLAEIWDQRLEQEVPEDSVAFWACLRRAYPDAATNAAQYESALANVAMVYAAGHETTAGTIATALAALAADADAMHTLEQVCAALVFIAIAQHECSHCLQ